MIENGEFSLCITQLVSVCKSMIEVILLIRRRGRVTRECCDGGGGCARD